MDLEAIMIGSVLFLFHGVVNGILMSIFSLILFLMFKIEKKMWKKILQRIALVAFILSGSTIFVAMFTRNWFWYYVFPPIVLGVFTALYFGKLNILNTKSRALFIVLVTIVYYFISGVPTPLWNQIISS